MGTVFVLYLFLAQSNDTGCLFRVSKQLVYMSHPADLVPEANCEAETSAKRASWRQNLRFNM